MDDNNLRGIPVKCNQVTVKKRKKNHKKRTIKIEHRRTLYIFLIKLFN